MTGRLIHWETAALIIIWFGAIAGVAALASAMGRVFSQVGVALPNCTQLIIGASVPAWIAFSSVVLVLHVWRDQRNPDRGLRSGNLTSRLCLLVFIGVAIYGLFPPLVCTFKGIR